MEEDNIRIKIKSINNEEHELCVKQSMNTEELKSILAEKKNVNKNDIRLIYQGQCLSNEKTISDYNIQNDHIIHLVVRKRDNANNDGDNKNDSTNANRINDNINDPLNINFASSMNQNNSSSTNTNNNASPFYFTHMRLTRNDNLENDLMGQSNIYSLLNDIMSQVNINPNFIYGAAAAAANDNIFANNINQNMNDYNNKGKENKNNEDDNNDKETNIKKDEEKKQKIRNSHNDTKNNDDTYLDIDQKKDREKKGKGKINEKEDEEKNRERKKMMDNKMEKEEYEDFKGRIYKDKKEEKEVTKKKKRKNINDEKKKYKNKNKEENTECNFNDFESSSDNESHSSNSGLSESDDTEEIKEEKKKYGKKIKKKRTKNKYKKKKYYDYSSYTSDDEPFKKDERIRKQNGNTFEESYYYPPNYFYNSNIRNDNNNNYILKKKNDFNKYPYPFIPNTLKGSYNEKQQYTHRDDFNEMYENINDDKVDNFLRKRDRKKKMFNDYKKNMLNSSKRNTNNIVDINNNISNKNAHNCKSMSRMSSIIKNSNECISASKDDYYYTKNNYPNIVPLSDTERDSEIIRNDSFRTNSRIAINEPAALSSNNSAVGNMRSIQMTSNRRNSTLRRSEPKCLNDLNNPEYKNVEINIPWRVIEQLLVLLEEETGYRRPDLSSYIHSYYNSNSIYVFFYLFVHINNIINSIIIQFNHANFLNNDISMSSFSRISLILSLASVIFSKLSNFFFVFYDNFYFPNYGNNYRNRDSINHEFLREIRNLYYSNNRNNNINNNRFYHTNHYNNNTQMNMDAYNQNSFPYPNNVNNNYYPLPYDMRNNCCSKTNLQQEFEDYYKNYLPFVKDGKSMILRKDNLNNKENNINQNNFAKEDNNNNSKISSGNKFCDKSLIESGINNIFLKNDRIKENNGSNNNSFLHFSNKNKSALNTYKKKRNDEKEKEKKKHHNCYNEKYLFKDIDSYKSDSKGSDSDSDSNHKNKKNNISSDFNSNALNIKEKKESIMNKFESSLKSTYDDKINEKKDNKNVHNENNFNDIEKVNDKNALNTILNNNLIFYDSNIDDIYDVSEDGKEKGLLVEKEEETKKISNTDTVKKEKLNDNVIEKKTEVSSENNKIKNVNNISPKTVVSNQNDNNMANNDNKKNPNKPSIPNFNLSNILNSVQGQMDNIAKDANANANDNFEGVPDEVKERYKNWVENSQIFSGQMIKICKNKRPLSNAYIGGNSSKDDISYSNLLQFIWKRNMSTLNVNLNLEVTEELLNSFDFHTLEFIMKSIRNNEDYKTEKFKYPSKENKKKVD
ncbi:ubiquitin-like protein, putative [Plasmodium relictum]|uniref:Ubiquitin-like protein, putative n=1 Tax=Plasmodium relictum TaxID=85471 RepID=A0A1J1H3W2_PLARL|nr:ubiquitin-like protein, putative [Plasmodium relictum]CRG99432.1 ubiquitin-like protein, putative [Plasmodium relictum]